MASYTNTQTKCSLFNELDQEQPRTYPDVCAALLFLCAVKHGDIGTTSRLDLTANTGPGPVRDGGGRVRLGFGAALQLLALVQWGGVLGGALHRQSGDVAQGRQQLQRLRAGGGGLHGRGCAS